MALLVSNANYYTPVTAKQKAAAYLNNRLLHRAFDHGTSPFKPIIRDVSLEIAEGEFVGIIGASGCGKTSLINTICNRLYTKTFDGTFELNGKRIGPWAKRCIGYVQQEDILCEHDTVRESIQFVADMRLPGVSHRDLVERIIDGLGLRRVHDSIIGSPAGAGYKAGANKTGISGGERRRTSIGRQLVSGCQLLMLDECTSGLDVHTANQIVQLLRELSQRPYDSFINPQSQNARLTVVTTIHQPTSQMWGLFDRILVMKQGEVWFSIRPSEFLADMAACSLSLPLNVNPADFLIEVLSQPDPRAEVLRRYYARGIAEVRHQQYYISEEPAPRSPVRLDAVDAGRTLHLRRSAAQLYQQMRVERRYELLQHAFISVYEVLHYSCKYAQPYGRQFLLLAQRAFRTQLRFPLMPFRFFLQYTVIAFVTGSLWWRLPDTFLGLNNKIGAVFFVEICITMAPSADVAQRYFEKRQVYLNEHAMGLYGTLPFLCAEMLADFFIYVFIIFYCVIIAYYMVDFNYQFLLYMLFSVELLLLLYCFITCALAITFLFASFVSAVAAFMTLFAILLVFSGPYINKNSIPPEWIWMVWFSPYTYEFRAYLYLILYRRQVQCVPGQICLEQLGVTPYEYFGQAGWTLTSATLCALGYMAGWCAVCFVLAYLMLRYRRFS